MITLVAITNDGETISEKFPNLNQIPPSRIEQTRLGWIDILEPATKDLSWLGKQFQFHPLALEDCAHFDQRPKIESYGDHLFIVVHALLKLKNELCIPEVHAFLTSRFIVTVHEEEIPALTNLKELLIQNAGSFPDREDFLLHRVLDSVVDSIPQVLTGIESESDSLEDAVLEEVKTLHIERILDLQQRLSQSKHILVPQKEIFNQLITKSYPQISEKAVIYFRDVYDHSVRVTQQLDQLRENLTSIREAYLALATYRTNEAIKRLTVFSVVFLPLTFITGFFGMNFEQLPWASNPLFMMVVATVFVLPLVMLLWFSRKDWL